MVRRALIVANQTIGGRELSAAVKQRIEEGQCCFHLLVPVPPTPPSAIAAGLAAVESAVIAMDLPDPRHIAEERLATGLEWLQSLGAEATGEVGPSDAVAGVEAVLQRTAIDEIIVSTLPSRISKWLRQDLPRRIERHVSVPVSVVTAGTDSP